VPPRGHDLGDEAHALRLVGLDDAAREDHVERAAQAHDARQALRAAVDQRDAEAALGEAEPAGLGGDAQVAPQRQLEPPGQAPAGDRGDRGLRRDQAGEAERAVVELQPRPEGLDRLEVGAGAEGQLAGAGQHQHAGVRVVDEALVGGGQQVGGRAVDRVAALLAIDREDGGRATALVGDRIGHGRLLVARIFGLDPDHPQRVIEHDPDVAAVPRLDAHFDPPLRVALDADHLTGSGIRERRPHRSDARPTLQLVPRERPAGTQLLVDAAQLEIVPEVHLDHGAVVTDDVDLPPVAVAPGLLRHAVGHPLHGDGLRVQRPLLVTQAKRQDHDGEGHRGNEDKQGRPAQDSILHPKA
jgi:hypothetical protein